MKREHLTILIVDDDPNDALLIERAFRANEIKDPIHTVADGGEAIAYLRGEGKFANRDRYEFPSFILTDLKMPLEDGFGILHEIRSHKEWSIVPIIILSGSNDENDIERAYFLGAKSYLVKPPTFDGLRGLMKKFHDYWRECETPRINSRGEMLPTNGVGKLGAKYN